MDALRGGLREGMSNEFSKAEGCDRATGAMPSSADILRELSAKRQADLVMTAHQALVARLRKDKEFAKRYPTLDLQPYRRENEVGLLVGTRRARSKRREYDWKNIAAVLQLDHGEAPAGCRHALALYAAHDVITNALIPKLLSALPNVTREEAVRLLRDAWPSSRGIRSTPMFDPRLVTAAYAALARENPSWGARALRDELAARLNVSARTVANLIRKKP